MDEPPANTTSGEVVEATGSRAIFTTPARGAQSFFVPLIVERQVKIYPILEPELESLSLLNTTATICLSIASGALGFMLNIAWNRVLRPDTPPVEQHVNTMEWGGIGLCVAIIVIAMVGFLAATKSKQSRIAALATQTRLGG